MSRTTLRLMFVGCLAAVSGCHGIEGSGVRVRQSRQVPDFTSIQSRVPFDIQVRQSDQTSVTLSLDSNLVSHVYTDVRNQILDIESDADPLSFVTGPHIIITMPHLLSAQTSDSGSFDAKTFDETDTVRLASSGTGSFTFAGSASRIEAVVDGSGDMHLTGKAEDEHLAVSDSGSLDARGVISKNAYVRISGAGGVSATVDGPVDVDVNGSGNVDLYGDVVIGHSYMFGPGEVRIH